MDRPFHEFSTATGDGVLLYRPHAMMPQAFEIVRKAGAAFIPIGQYMVLDPTEDPQISEKKVMNLVSLMNGDDRLIDLGGDHGRRLYFHVVPCDGSAAQRQIVFRERGATGVTAENAILAIDKEYWT